MRKTCNEKQREGHEAEKTSFEKKTFSLDTKHNVNKQRVHVFPAAASFRFSLNFFSQES